MELNMIGLASTVIAVAAGAYFLLFGVIWNFNEWYFCSVKKKFKSPLPPGDMGWPVFGNMKTYLNAYKNQDPDSYTFNLIKRYGETGVYKAHLFGKPHAVVITPETSRTVLVDEEKFKLGYPSLIERAGREEITALRRWQ
ncbi:ent-kaurenoic acid oxidase 2-like [Tripterygium wilfordii]|uniref:ent-kaurenoic acid oxidase 2-like n=1 Tax=Tripterygium wilfordii TaxID=458696 RepID=UPI0018F85049|nr:ent-kaurenoic acid oxidase 2-like [Tripterygium wilfordii]